MTSTTKYYFLTYVNWFICKLVMIIRQFTLLYLNWLQNGTDGQLKPYCLHNVLSHSVINSTIGSCCYVTE